MGSRIKQQRKRGRKRLELQRRRILFCALSATICITLVIFFNNSYGTLPALGKFLSPHLGIWQNALKDNRIQSTKTIFTNVPLKPHTILVDTRAVPHIFASGAEDAYFLQGYLQAKDRLWQMDFNARIAAGRTAEVVGVKGLELDKFMRKMGIREMAEKMERLMKQDKLVKIICDAYTKGVNAYIQSLNYTLYPVEFKIYSYRPELWTNYKTALLMKLFAYDWGSYERDIFRTNFIKTFGAEQYASAFPDVTTIDMPSFSPAVTGSLAPSKPPTPLPKEFARNYYESVPRIYPKKKLFVPNYQKSSTSWVLSPSKTESKKPMLGVNINQNLSLPNYWYELQISYNDYNVYGFTYPGIPGVLIGFNNYIAWGLNNTQIDTKDYLHVSFVNASKSAYKTKVGINKPIKKIVEHYKVKGGLGGTDTLFYTDMGVIFWDYKNTTNLDVKEGYVMRFKSLAPSDDLKGFLLLNRAKNYIDYQGALEHIQSPLLYLTYADIYGHSGVNLQGSIPVRLEEQGQFLSPSENPIYTWQRVIPRFELPYMIDPPLGFSFVADGIPFYKGDYPYFLGGTFSIFKSKRLYNLLRNAENIKKENAIHILNDKYSAFAEEALPILLHNLDITKLNENVKGWIKILQNWNYKYRPLEKAPTIFTVWLHHFIRAIWDDDLRLLNMPYKEYPSLASILYLLQNGNFVNDFVDNRDTKKVLETLKDITQQSFEKSIITLHTLQKSHRLAWGTYNKVKIPHLSAVRSLALDRLSPAYAPEQLSDNEHTYTTEGSSLKMLVTLSSPVKAYTSMLGGQSGSPCSPFYKGTIADWEQGKLREVLFLQPKENLASEQLLQTIYFDNHKSESKWHLF